MAPKKKTITQRVTELEALVAKLVAATPSVQVSVTPSDGSTAGWTNGMSQPDARGRVRLEGVERNRAAWSDLLRGKNATLPEWFYVAEAAKVFPLNEVQNAHVTMNTGVNASSTLVGRWGAMYDVEKVVNPITGRVSWETRNSQPDAWGIIGPTVADALREVEQMVRNLASGTASPAYPVR